MTAHLKCCGSCNEGLVRFDPQTGESKCGNCFSNGDPPIVVGGQGRDAESIGWSATVAGICLGLAALVVFVAAIVAAVGS